MAELIASVMGYVAGAGIEARWLVVEADDDFFAFTKGLHNRLHGQGNGGGVCTEANLARRRGSGPGDAVSMSGPLPFRRRQAS